MRPPLVYFMIMFILFLLWFCCFLFYYFFCFYCFFMLHYFRFVIQAYADCYQFVFFIYDCNWFVVFYISFHCNYSN